jgi:hypothetical protein
MCWLENLFVSPIVVNAGEGKKIDDFLTQFGPRMFLGIAKKMAQLDPEIWPDP